jgi:hypothetical protein
MGGVGTGGVGSGGVGLGTDSRESCSGTVALGTGSGKSSSSWAQHCTVSTRHV